MADANAPPPPKYRPPPRAPTAEELKAANPFAAPPGPPPGAATANVSSPPPPRPAAPPAANPAPAPAYRPPPGPPPSQARPPTTYAPPPRPPPAVPFAAPPGPLPALAAAPPAAPAVYGSYPSPYTVAVPHPYAAVAPGPVARTPIPPLEQNPYIYRSMQLRGPVSGARPPRKVCLYIGICYFNGRRPLKGCINDVSAMRTFLSQTYGFPATEPDCLFLADSAPDPMYQPTRTNILWAMQWLIHGSQKGDSLILHFSGHGGRQKTEDYADEPDGYDETILPVDHLVSGEILDNEMNELLVQAAPAGVKLTAIFDACHSGSILDLMYVHDFDAAADEQRAVGAAAVNTAIGDQIKDSAPYRPPPAPGSTAPAQTGGNGVPHVTATLASFSNKAPASPTTSITCFSASTDYQESADTWLIGIPSGALSLAFISVLVEDPRGMTYAELFWRIRNWLAERGKQQTAMISTSGWRDLNAEIFSL